MKLSFRVQGHLHWPVLILGLFLTYLSASYVHWTGARDEERRFEIGTKDIVRKIQLRFARYENSLVQTRAFILSSTDVSRDEFHRYFESIELLRRYPGLLGLGHAEAKRGVTPLSAIVHHIEPVDLQKIALGFDLGSETHRRRAMELARDRNRAVMTDMVTLFKDTSSEASPAFLIFLPLYDTLNPFSVEARRNELRGFVYAPFRASELFHAIFSDEHFPIDFRVHYTGGTEDVVLFDFQEVGVPVEKPLRGIKPLRIFGQPFEIHFTTLRSFHNRGFELGVLAVALGGTLVSILFALIVYLNHRRAIEKTKEADALKIKEEALKRALKSRDEFLSIAAHELKTPLTALQLQLQFADGNAEKSGLPSLERYRRFLSLCEESVMRLILLVGDLLDITRIDSGRLRFSFKKTSLTGLLNRAILLLDDPLRNTGCSVELKISEEVELLADEFKLEQVFLNLLMNSTRYAPGSTIVIETKKEGALLRITYTDSGPGISKEFRDRAFDRYERGDPTGSVQGLGLGLYIAREIIRGHGGKIWLSDECASGVCFRIDLPLTEPLAGV